MQENEKVEAQDVLDAEQTPQLVFDWLEEAGKVNSLETFQKLSERLLSDVRYTVDTLPVVYGVIALASLKMASGSKHGKLNEEQLRAVAQLLIAALT